MFPSSFHFVVEFDFREDRKWPGSEPVNKEKIFTEKRKKNESTGSGLLFSSVFLCLLHLSSFPSRKWRENPIQITTRNENIIDISAETLLASLPVGEMKQQRSDTHTHTATTTTTTTTTTAAAAAAAATGDRKGWRMNGGGMRERLIMTLENGE